MTNMIEEIIDQARRTNARSVELAAGDPIVSVDGRPTALGAPASGDEIAAFLGDIAPTAVRLIKAHGAFHARWLDQEVSTFLRGHEQVREGVAKLAIELRFAYPG